MDSPNSENQMPHDESAPHDHGQSGQAVELPNDPEELKKAVHERDLTIAELRERNGALQEKLNQKDQVVQALTARLEQAAEQLDRLRRSGADRGGKLLAGIPAEVIEEQKTLINDLKATIKSWEELQGESAMGRVETQLIELRKMLADQLELKKQIEEKKSAPAEAKAGEGGKKSSWEQMKQQLLGSEKHGAQAAPAIPGAANDVRIPGKSAKATGKPQTPAEEAEITPPSEIEIDPRPEAIEDLEKAEPEALRAAIVAREAHIDHLMGVISQLKQQAGTGEFEQMKKRQAELEEQLRKTEVEMAQERARLSRKEADLQKLAKTLESQPVADKDKKEGHPKEEKTSRWSRFLGSG
jgi:hypothetical protein